MVNHFDELAKGLAGGMSRRQALRRVGRLVAGGLLATVGLVALTPKARAQAHPSTGRATGPVRPAVRPRTAAEEPPPPGEPCGFGYCEPGLVCCDFASSLCAPPGFVCG
jgi:hypothetical protein